MADVDLAIVGATLVTPSGRRPATVYVNQGQIAAIGDHKRLAARRTFDAGGLLLMPGGVDTHVHLMDPGNTEREDFPSGTRAAARSGVTTIIEHSHGRPIRSAAQLREKVQFLRGRANVDFGLAAHAWPGDTAAAPELWAAGASFFKVFTCTTHGIPGHDAAALQAHLNCSAAVGAVSLIHCEDESLIQAAETTLRAEGREDWALIPEWRNRDAEVIATLVTAVLVRRTGARATVAHVSHPEVAEYVKGERARGAAVMAETCPQYLLLREHELGEQGGLGKFTPPARARTDADEQVLWQLLKNGVLTHISTDHAPATREQKKSGSIWEVHFGLPGLDTTMALLLDAAANGKMAYEDVARLYCEVPARIYGLWPRKGHVGPDADADLILVDPNAEYPIRDADILSKAGWTPYHGRVVRGRVTHTFLRGQLISEAGVPADGRSGKFLPGPGHRTQ